jgi:hypothetical protein
MRKYGYLAVAAGAALVLSVPAGVAVAANVHKAPKAVLTIGKVNGSAVKDKAVLKASLPKGGKVTFAAKVGSVTCTSSSITAKVVKNPAKAGEATLSVTGVSVSKCGTILGFNLSLTALNLPSGATIKTSKGDPVTITEASKSKPLGFKVTVTSKGTVAATCIFIASSLSGNGSNKKNTVAFSKQKLTLDTAKSSSLCTDVGTSATVTATYGPIVDSSVKHSPKVFIS